MTNNTVSSTARVLGAGLRALLVRTLVCGVVYPLAVTGAAQYSLLLSGATNRSGDNEELVQWVKDAKAAMVKDNSTATHKVDPDAVTSSGSGLDPDISPAYAKLQVHRVADKNGLDVKKVESLVADHTTGRLLGFMEEPRVNVLELNTALRDLTR
ncbi:potassium-transporting ATPase subunit C [Streptomyces rubiginosohelvolus]|uniref:potassium-transporting ATPase subunit C n=1 Tax=Streptomyces rubiginosohelvolus TaxID=67362 RepID=UPI0037ABE6AA